MKILESKLRKIVQEEVRRAYYRPTSDPHADLRRSIREEIQEEYFQSTFPLSARNLQEQAGNVKPEVGSMMAAFALPPAALGEAFLINILAQVAAGKVKAAELSEELKKVLRGMLQQGKVKPEAIQALLPVDPKESPTDNGSFWDEILNEDVYGQENREFDMPDSADSGGGSVQMRDPSGVVGKIGKRITSLMRKYGRFNKDIITPEDQKALDNYKNEIDQQAALKEMEKAKKEIFDQINAGFRPNTNQIKVATDAGVPVSAIGAALAAQAAQEQKPFPTISPEAQEAWKTMQNPQNQKKAFKETAKALGVSTPAQDRVVAKLLGNLAQF